MHISRATTTALLLLIATLAHGKAKPSIDGTWTGTVDMGGGLPTGTASGALAQSGRKITGSLTVDAGPASGVFTVAGKVKGAHVVAVGKHDSRKLRWKARWDERTSSWRGPMMERGGVGKMHGTLALVRDAGGGPTCGGDYFASDVMPVVIDRICIQCHVPGGQAQAAPFKVTPGNPVATARSAAREVDPADPTHSKLIMKPRLDVPHGGGLRIRPGSNEEQILLHWIALVTAPGCDLGVGGGPRTGAELYAENCASCHGPDARGLDGRPDIHCNRDVSDAVRNGRSGPSGDMQAFTTLSHADVAKIQSFLDGLCPVSGVTGEALFTSNCATCHGAGAVGTDRAPNVRCATRAEDAMRIGRGTAMPSFPAITDPEVALVDAYLTAVCDQSGRQGTDLFAGNCSTCHGADAAGGTNGLGVQGPDIRCSRGIAEPVTTGVDADMPAFPRLGAADVAAMQAYLTTTFCPAGTVTGSELYVANCASCHGADARGVNGKPDVRCNRSIHDAVVTGGSGPSGTMPPFAMSDPEIALVQGYLLGLCPVGSATGGELFASNCATCHGPAAVGTATAPRVRCATRVADAMQKGRGALMPAFPNVVATEVTSIQGYVTGLCNQFGRTGLDLYAGNCTGCHGVDAGGGVNGLGVHGPDIQCTGANDYTEKIRFGSDAMPPFPAIGTDDVTAIVGYVTGTFCR